MDEKVCGEVRLVDNILQAEDFVRLRIETGFAEIPVEHARKALKNGLLNVSAIYNGELVGMGRLVLQQSEVFRQKGKNRFMRKWVLILSQTELKR